MMDESEIKVFLQNNADFSDVKNAGQAMGVAMKALKSTDYHFDNSLVKKVVEELV